MTGVTEGERLPANLGLLVIAAAVLALVTGILAWSEPGYGAAVQRRRAPYTVSQSNPLAISNADDDKLRLPDANSHPDADRRTERHPNAHAYGNAYTDGYARWAAAGRCRL